MRFVVGGTNGWERERPQVPDGVIGRTPRALLELGRVVRVCVFRIDPLSGEPCPPFYRSRGSRVYRQRKRALRA